MNGNAKVAAVHRALSWLYAFGAALIFLVFCQSVFSRAPEVSPGGVLLVLLIVLGIVALHRSAARAAARNRPWARTLSRAIAVLLLIGFPVGTALGVYILYHCRQNRWPLSGSSATDPQSVPSLESPGYAHGE